MTKHLDSSETMTAIVSSVPVVVTVPVVAAVVAVFYDSSTRIRFLR
jgi:hypothetical protein